MDFCERVKPVECENGSRWRCYGGNPELGPVDPRFARHPFRFQFIETEEWILESEKPIRSALSEALGTAILVGLHPVVDKILMNRGRNSLDRMP